MSVGCNIFSVGRALIAGKEMANKSGILVKSASGKDKIASINISWGAGVGHFWVK